LRWEIKKSPDNRWWNYSKGGGYSPYFTESDLVVNWLSDGAEVKAYSAKLYGSWSKQITNTQYFGKPGLTYASRTHRELAAAFQPPQSAFDTKGCCIFSEDELPDHSWLALLGVINSRMFAGLLRVGLARATSGLARQYTESLVLAMPIPDIANLPELSRLVGAAHKLHALIDATNETASNFDLRSWIALLREQKAGESIEIYRKAARRTWESQLLSAAEIDVAATASYQRGADQSAGIAEYLNADVGKIPVTVREATAAGYWNPLRESPFFLPDENPQLESRKIAQALLSVAVGATTQRRQDSHSSQAVVSSAEGGAADSRGISARTDGVLFVDDLGHRADLAIRLHNLFDDGDMGSFSVALDRLAILASERRSGLRDYFRQEFFLNHLQTYSSSKRRAPVYWQIATPSLSYSVWCHFRDITKDTLFSVHADYAGPKLEHERKQLEALRSDAGPNPSSGQRKAIETQEALVAEIQSFVDEVKRVAPLWNPDIDDGAIINFAPLWRLVPQSKPWQKELHKTWEALCKGSYDWARLAMHLWPERVVPKCAVDRSLAIAHGLEDVFWREGDDGKWQKRSSPSRPTDEIVRDRTSAAVKAALEELSKASVPNGPKARARRTSS
jgi:hypothetical protein